MFTACMHAWACYIQYNHITTYSVHVPCHHWSTCIYIDIYIHPRIYIYASMCTDPSINLFIYIYTRAYTHTNAFVYTYTRAQEVASAIPEIGVKNVLPMKRTNMGGMFKHINYVYYMHVFIYVYMHACACKLIYSDRCANVCTYCICETYAILPHMQYDTHICMQSNR